VKSNERVDAPSRNTVRPVSRFRHNVRYYESEDYSLRTWVPRSQLHAWVPQVALTHCRIMGAT